MRIPVSADRPFRSALTTFARIAAHDRGAPTKALNQAVKHNSERFPDEFMFQLSQAEKDEVVTNCDHLAKLKFSKTLPYAFTEHGALMVATVLNTQRAVEVSLYVVRAFVKLRELLASNKELAAKLNELERKLESHDQAITGLIHAIRELMKPPETKKRPIGFVPPQEKKQGGSINNARVSGRWGMLLF